MKKITLIATVLAMTYLLMPSQGTAIILEPASYMAIGSIDDQHGNTLLITGEMHIGNNLYEWTTGKTIHHPSEIPGYDGYGINEYGLDIPSFSLDVGGYNFYGSGFFYMTLYRCPDEQSALEFGHTEWYLHGSEDSQWPVWSDSFSTARPFDIEDEFFVLADMISFTFIDFWGWDCPILGPRHQQTNFNLTLTRYDHASVPEPSTAILFGASLVGLIAYKRLLNKRN